MKMKGKGHEAESADHNSIICLKIKRGHNKCTTALIEGRALTIF
jgi:hypothetical protein